MTFDSTKIIFIAVVAPVAVLFCSLAWWSVARLRNLGAQRHARAIETNEINHRRQKNRLNLVPQPRLYEIWTEVVGEKVMDIGSVKSFEEIKVCIFIIDCDISLITAPLLVATHVYSKILEMLASLYTHLHAYPF
jgi:hypothetical protein